MLIATLRTPFEIVFDFYFDAATNAALKRCGAEWHGKEKLWTLPITRLDKLIAVLGDTLTCDAEVWLAAPPKLPAQVAAENAAWMGQTPGAPQVAAVQPIPAGATKLDRIMAENAGEWAARAERKQAMSRGRKPAWVR